jgi:hypothetical protein
MTTGRAGAGQHRVLGGTPRCRVTGAGALHSVATRAGVAIKRVSGAKSEEAPAKGIYVGNTFIACGTGEIAL